MRWHPTWLGPKLGSVQTPGNASARQGRKALAIDSLERVSPRSR
ncbi:Hypothetical protein AA314_01291 [Archangium gephyra]|uniref:Uncharacterized protein n=1 Tax=Archangium gephyra TaxID=48 RepID=A0AAC8Q271_9BACT|nr:Hypothetical protein AA314_01291 [Archangium gephyra]